MFTIVYVTKIVQDYLISQIILITVLMLFTYKTVVKIIIKYNIT